jgi:hypothetical protein
MGIGVGKKGLLVIMVGRFTDYGLEFPVEVVEEAKEIGCLGRGEEVCCFWSEEIRG